MNHARDALNICPSPDTCAHVVDIWLRHVQAPAPRPVPAKDIPSHLRVCCGTMRGNFDVQRALVILDGGREISPTEFERMAGKAASKKWKASVRIDKVSSCSAFTHCLWQSHCISEAKLLSVTQCACQEAAGTNRRARSR